MSSNTIVESTVAPAPARVAPVQRKKKTVPVITKYEESTYETPIVVSSGIPQSPEVAQTGAESMAETLLTIIQTKPVIQMPKYKKKNVTVADVVAPKIPKQNKKKNVEPAPEPGIVEFTYETPSVVSTGTAQSNIDNIESLTVVEQVVAETPKAPKKRAPKKKAEVVIPEQTVVYEQNIENIESPMESVQENTLEIGQTKAPKKRAPKKKAEVVIPEQTGIVESNIDNIESLVGNMTLEEVPAAVPIEVPKAPKKRAPKKKAEVVIPEQTVVYEQNIENIESLFGNMTMEEVPAAVPIEAPKKRVSKKKAEVVIPEQTGIVESNIDNIESPMESVQENTLEVVQTKAPKKRVSKKKAEVVIPEQTGIVESNIENIESLFGNMTLEEVPAVVPIEAPKKRVSKKKAEVVIPEQTGIVEQNIDNIESLVEAVVSVEVPKAPKAPKKRAPKKKAEVVIPEQTVVYEQNIDNIESLFGNMTLEEVPAAVPIEVPKAPKKRVSKKKAEVVIPEQTVVYEQNIENIESPMESVQENTLEMNKEDNGMEWFNEQVREVQIRREPILATFAETSQELVDEIYEATTIKQFTYETPNVVSTGIAQMNPIEEEDKKTTLYGNLQPIADIIEDTLENEDDDYSEQIMVETFEFDGQLYWIDEENRVLDKQTFQHIGQYDDSTAAIMFYA